MASLNELSYIGPRRVQPLSLEANGLDMGVMASLRKLGITIREKDLISMADAAYQAFAQDAITNGLTTASIGTPIQFLQSWLPGFVNIITQARKIDDFVGIVTQGEWKDEEVVQGILEQTGNASPYTDYGNVPLTSWNANFDRRTIVRFEEGLRVGVLEEARSAAMRINSADQKRGSAAVSLEIERNKIGFYGYNNGDGRTYGLLNDPNLPAYVNVATGVGGLPWSTKTFLEIVADIREAIVSLRTNSGDVIDPENVDITLGLPTNCIDYLSVTSTFGNSVRDWLKVTYPRVRVVSAPQLQAANGGANVFYLYAENVADGSSDDGRTFIQIVPAKFMTLGVKQDVKDYVESFTNATAGVMCKRPYAVVRRSGI